MSGTSPPPSDLMKLEDARWRLAKVWLISAFILFGAIVVQSILGRYADHIQDAWSWFIPSIVPTLSLMIGVLGEGAMKTQSDDRVVRSNFFKLAYWLSTAYLITLAVTIFLAPFAEIGVIQLYRVSNYWLGPIQGLVGGAIGLLFTSQQRGKDVPPPGG